jgi:hypothetical protein
MVGTGLGQTASTGTVSLIPPSRDITRTGQEEVIDRVRIVFQIKGPKAWNEHLTIDWAFTDTGDRNAPRSATALSPTAKPSATGPVTTPARA